MRILLLVSMFFTLGADAMAQKLPLVSNGKSTYVIVIPSSPTTTEQRAATVLQDYINRISGCKLDIKKEGKIAYKGIYIGNTGKADVPRALKDESYVIYPEGASLVICGRNGMGTLYGVYALLEQQLGCRKLDAGPAKVPKNKNITVWATNTTSEPAFIYRQAYYPMEQDAEYLHWHKLHRLEDLWGLWGHSLPRLLPAAQYFKQHPEYFARVNGSYANEQLCLSNKRVYEIVLAELKKRIAANDDAMYWSVAPGDGHVYCQCSDCEKVNRTEGSPSGTLIRFVNKIASQFPDKKFTTLAYLQTQKPPTRTKPAANVYIFLTSINIPRDLPLEQEPIAANFRKYLSDWAAITPNLFLWDYSTQFTNYLTPFPDLHTIEANIRYFKKKGVKGIFEQGSGETRSSFDALKSYLYAKAMWNDRADADALMSEFTSGYYGAAAPHVTSYINAITSQVKSSKAKLDIYGNPVNDTKTYLTPTAITKYQDLLNKALKAVQGRPVEKKRVEALKLSLEYVVLQQSRFYGIEPGGMFTKKGNSYIIKPDWPARVHSFATMAQAQGVKELSEGGLSPAQYEQEWKAIFERGYVQNIALNASVSLAYPHSEYYPAKGTRTLTDGVIGYADFSYNWLHFYGVPMHATIDMGRQGKASTVSLQFLHDPRHEIFAPDDVSIQIAGSDKNFVTIPLRKKRKEMDNGIYTVEYTADVTSGLVRYVRIKAGYKHEPEVRSGKKPAILCDEVYVQ